MELPSEADIMHSWRSDLDKPVLSMCCTAYNHEAYIEDTLRGFLLQKTDFPFEIVVHDDASTDGTAGIIALYAEKYPKIVRPIFQAENKFSSGGFVMARFVFPKARGKYIAMCEGDDYWVDPMKSQKQVDFLEDNWDYVLCYTSIVAFDASGSVENYHGGARRDLSSLELQRAYPLNTLTVCFRNVPIELTRELRDAKVGDRVLWSLLGAHGKGKYLSDIGPSRYRMHDGGIFSKKARSEKLWMTLLTDIALYSYHRKVSSGDLSRYFGLKVVRSLCVQIGVGGFLIGAVKEAGGFALRRARDIAWNLLGRVWG